MNTPMGLEIPPRHGSPNKFSGLEGLRGILCVSVMLGHYGIDKALTKIGLSFQFSYAVDIFFIISGLVLAHSNYRSPHCPSFREFAIKRIARLYPLHIASLIVVVTTFFFIGRKYSTSILLQNILFLQNVGLPPNRYDLNVPSWSASVEFWTSIVFYVFTRYIPPRLFTTLTLTWVLFVVFAIPEALISYPPANIAVVANTGLIRGFTGFAIGISMYSLAIGRQRSLLLDTRLLAYTCVFILILIYLWKLEAFIVPAFYFTAAIIVGALARHDSFLHFLTSRPFQWLGRISFSIYLLHMPMVYVLQALLGASSVKGPGKLLLITVVVISSEVTYRYLERPAQLLVRNMLLPRTANRRGQPTSRPHSESRVQ